MPACLAAAPDCWGGVPVPGGLPGQGLDWPPAPGPRPLPAPLALGVGPPRLLATLVVHRSSCPLSNDAGMAGAGAQLQWVCRNEATFSHPVPSGCRWAPALPGRLRGGPAGTPVASCLCPWGLERAWRQPPQGIRSAWTHGTLQK